MFSVTKTELNVFPLCTKNVWPTKSGVTIERRDHVLIGFFTPALSILSIFSRRYNSTKGPFFNDLAIIFKSIVEDRALRDRRHRAPPSTTHDFFSGLLLSTIKRPLRSWFLPVLNPLT